MQAADVADAFDRLPDDTAPTLLALLDSLDDEDATVIADARPVSYQVTSCAEEVAGTSTESKAKTKTKKTWRQRQRLEVLRLRDEVQELDAELKKLMLVAGVRSTVPERAGTTESTLYFVCKYCGFGQCLVGIKEPDTGFWVELSCNKK
ncbi:hypothetical protein PF003_g10889 [Phytophthora fragariae]|nr:hypothetical protein PF003_g10889 [Phytophthora fragariae]